LIDESRLFPVMDAPDKRTWRPFAPRIVEMRSSSQEKVIASREVNRADGVAKNFAHSNSAQSPSRSAADPSPQQIKLSSSLRTTGHVT
jgi:hypothetical protein